MDTQNTGDAAKDDHRAYTSIDTLRARARLVRVLVFLLFWLLLLVYLPLFRRAIIDDAYIGLDYARSLLQAGTWGMYPGHLANTATSPLNVLLLTALTFLFGPTPSVVLWLAGLCFATIAIALENISRRLFQTPGFGWMATLALLFNPLLISALGLESILFATLLVLAVGCYLASRWCWLGLIIGLLSMTRPDGLLFGLIFMLFLPGLRVRLQYLVAFVLSSAPWYAFSWIVLGSLVPDTLFIKTSMASYVSVNYFNGLWLYWHQYPLETALSLLFLPLLATVVLRRIRRVAVLRLLFVLGLAHFLAYSVLHVPPFHWYYVPDVVIAILFGTIGLGVIYKNASPHSALRIAVAGAAAEYALIPLLGMGLLLARVGFHFDQMPILTNWGTAAQYERVGTWLERHLAGSTVALSGEIGTMSYYAPDCYLVNEFSDRRWLIEAVEAKRSTPGLAAMIYRANFLFLRPAPDFPPAAYFLNGYADWKANDNSHLMEWDISTKWRPKSLVVLTRY